MTLGEIVRSYRDSHSMTMAEFAERAGLSKGYISMLEKNRNPRTGAPIIPSITTYEGVSKATGLSVQELMESTRGEDISLSVPAAPAEPARPHRKGVKIPVLGYVRAGIPMYAEENIIDYEEISQQWARSGEYFGLRIRGDSMLPTLHDGDTIIVRKQSDVDNGDIAIVLVNGDDATVKEIHEEPDGVTLIGHNVAVYAPHFYSNRQIQELPVQIIGKVVELRRKF